jgi:PleD family two-component response regulator
MRTERACKSAFFFVAALSTMGFNGLAGCDMGLEDSANRYETLNLQTKDLLEVLKQISTEETANAHLSELQAAANKVRESQQKINESAEKRAEKGGGGMSRITNHRQAGLFIQTADSARRQADRVREADAKAGAIVDKALEGIEFPEPTQGSPIAL